MNTKQLLISFGKLFLCGLVYFVGLIVGGMITSLLQLPAPPIPEGLDQSSVALAMLAVSPILAGSLALLAPNLAGGWLTRTLILSTLTYIAYTLNTVLDASLYLTAYASTSASTTLSGLVPSLFCGSAVALLFPPKEKGQSFVDAWKAFFRQMSPGQWAWRLLSASIVFMPIYLLFGLIVQPITGEYYRQHMFGLKAAGWDQILPILFVRSLLFLVACFPVFIAWQKSERRLFLNLGMALFILVGFLYMLMAYWLPPIVRVPHSIEILADSFVYAGALTWLLTGQFPLLKGKRPLAQTQLSEEKTYPG